MPPGTSGERSRHRRSASPSPTWAAPIGSSGARGWCIVSHGSGTTIASRGAPSARALERGAAEQRLGMRHAGRARQRAEDVEPPVEPAQRPVADRRWGRVVQAPQPCARETRRPSPPPTASRGSGLPVADGRGRARRRSAARVARAELSSEVASPQPREPVGSSSDSVARGSRLARARTRRAGQRGRRGGPSRRRSPSPRGRCRRARGRPSGSAPSPRVVEATRPRRRARRRSRGSRVHVRAAAASRARAAPARLSSPPATSTVWRSGGIPARVSSSSVAASAARRGSSLTSGIGSAGELNDDRRPPTACREDVERLTREREAQSLGDGRVDVGDRVERRRRRQEHRIVGERRPTACG